MNQRCFRVSEDGKLSELTGAGSLAEAGSQCAWIDVEDFSEEDLPGWLASIGFGSRPAEAAAALRGRTRVAVNEEATYFEFPALGSSGIPERVPLAFLCRPGLCVTVHRKPIEGLESTARRLAMNGELSGNDTSSLVATLLAGLSARAVEAMEEIRRMVLEMQGLMDRDPDDVDIAQIHDLSHAIRTLDAVIGERIVVLDRLRLTTSPSLNLGNNREFLMAVSDAQYVDRAVDRIETRVSHLRAEYALHQQDRTNHRLAVLTVLSAIFLPLTLVAGIYGMNFEFMPELSYRYAYPIALGAMLLLGLGMIGWFRSRGWFD
ncbi:MAG: CorA family divalent cation transporter [marine benthic group bacterium]|nr:CorA family divalent cation transporter [Gemmatimonadota bacterium]